MIAPMNFKIMQLNVNSIKSKQKSVEFSEFLKKHSPQIVLLSETNLKEKSALFIPKYKIFRNDRLEKEGGGTAICISENLDCEYVPVPNKVKSIECCIVKIKQSNKETMYFASVYKPPSKKVNGKNTPIKINVNDLNEILNIEKECTVCDRR